MPNAYEDVRPQLLEQTSSGVHRATGNRIDLMDREDSDDPIVQAWMETWYGPEVDGPIKHIRIPICDIDAFIDALTDMRDRIEND